MLIQMVVHSYGRTLPQVEGSHEEQLWSSKLLDCSWGGCCLCCAAGSSLVTSLAIPGDNATAPPAKASHQIS